MPLVKVGSKHQVVIPKNVRDMLGIAAGDYVEISFDRGRAVLVRKKLVDDIPLTTEKLGPKTKASIRRGRQEVRQGKAGPPLRGKKQIQGHLDALKKNK